MVVMKSSIRFQFASDNTATDYKVSIDNWIDRKPLLAYDGGTSSAVRRVTGSVETIAWTWASAYR